VTHDDAQTVVPYRQLADEVHGPMGVAQLWRFSVVVQNDDGGVDGELCIQGDGPQGLTRRTAESREIPFGGRRARCLVGNRSCGRLASKSEPETGMPISRGVQRIRQMKNDLILEIADEVELERSRFVRDGA